MIFNDNIEIKATVATPLTSLLELFYNSSKSISAVFILNILYLFVGEY